MNPSIVHGSRWAAHGYWPIPPTCCCGWSGSQLNFDIWTLPRTGTAPAAVPRSLYACSVVSTQKFVLPTSVASTLAPFGPAATDGWNWSVVDEFAASLTTVGVDHVRPPSVDCVNFTSICVPSQSSYVR